MKLEDGIFNGIMTAALALFLSGTFLSLTLIDSGKMTGKQYVVTLVLIAAGSFVIGFCEEAKQ